MILNVDDLSNFNNDNIKTVIRSNEDSMCILPTTNMGTFMDLITYNLIPTNIKRIYIIGHYINIIIMEELEIFINHLYSNRSINPRSIDIIVDYNTMREFGNELYQLGINVKQVYYNYNIKELNITYLHTNNRSKPSTININKCNHIGGFEYTIGNECLSYHKLKIIGL